MVDIDYVRRVLDYDKETGVIKWKERTSQKGLSWLLQDAGIGARSIPSSKV